MSFETVRYVILLIVLAGITLSGVRIAKSNIKLKKLTILIAAVGFIAFYQATALTPLENLFITFPTLKEACEYKDSGEVKIILDGEQSAMVWFVRGRTNAYSVFYKKDGGYKLGTPLSYRHITGKALTGSPFGIQIDIYHVKNTDDYYISAFDAFAENDYEVTDNYKSEYHKLVERVESSETILAEYYAHVRNLNEDYVLTIDSETYGYSSVFSVPF
jgi:hypothetical protein